MANHENGKCATSIQTNEHRNKNKSKFTKRKYSERERAKEAKNPCIKMAMKIKCQRKMAKVTTTNFFRIPSIRFCFSCYPIVLLWQKRLNV